VYGKNFLKTILRLLKEMEKLSVLSDQFGAPIAASLIADVTAFVLRRMESSSESHSDKLELYHLTAASEASLYGYSSVICEAAVEQGIPLSAVPEKIHPTTISGYPVPSKRPMNSCLYCQRLEKAFGMRMTQWHSEGRHSLTLLSNLNYV
jgi:dTDP-4-dehydrorhamnose reductase